MEEATEAPTRVYTLGQVVTLILSWLDEDEPPAPKPANVTIYSLSDPRDNSLRYIGQTRQELKQRLNGHMSDRGKNSRTAWIAELRAAGLAPVMTFVETVEGDAANKRERYWIKYYKNQGETLFNGTPAIVKSEQL